MDEQAVGTGTIAEPDLNPIDLVTLLSVVWLRKATIFLGTAFLALATLLLQFFIPYKYTYSAYFALQADNRNALVCPGLL